MEEIACRKEPGPASAEARAVVGDIWLHARGSLTIPVTARLNLDNRGNDLADTPLQLTVIRYWRTDGHLGGSHRRDAARDHLSGIDEESRRNAFLESVPAQVSHLLEIGRAHV